MSLNRLVKLGWLASRALVMALSPSANANAILVEGRRLARASELLKEMIRRELTAVHAGHSLGTAWVFFQPLLTVLIYLLIFGFVLGSKVAVTQSFPGDFPSYLLVGLVPWLALQAALTRTPHALVGNANLVKQVVFPIETLPFASACAALIPYIPAFGVVLLYKAVIGGLPLTVLLMPIPLAFLVGTAIGMGFILASLTAFVRDIREFVLVLCMLAMYLTPAVYLPDWMPEPLRPLLYLNPFSYLIWTFQDVFFFGEIRHPVAWVVSAVLAILSLGVGARLFNRLKPMYGNVL